jgi:hypothetical protein
MKTNVIIIIILFGLIIINSCNGITEPELQPGRRDYMWSVDTIKTGNEVIILLDIWGSSPDNIWGIAMASAQYSIWHYDGLNWTRDYGDRRISPWAIWGVNKYEVWMGNQNSTIWKYNGTNWNLHTELKIEGYDNIIIQDLYGNSYNNIWGCGYAEIHNTDKYIGILTKYNGTKWEIINIPDTRIGFGQITIDEKSKNLIISGTVYEQNPPAMTFKIYSWDGKELKEIFSSLSDNSISSVGGKVYMVNSRKIYRYNQDRFEYLKEFPDTKFLGWLFGRNEKDFFAIALDGIGHYNGTDFTTVYKTESWTRGGFIFDKDVFFIMHNFQNRLNTVVHGKLKE